MSAIFWRRRSRARSRIFDERSRLTCHHQGFGGASLFGTSSKCSMGLTLTCAALAATTPTSDLEAAAIMREFQNLRQYVQELESARWLDSVSTSSVELGLVYFLEEVAREVLVRESDFALHPGRSEGYSVMSQTRWFEVVLGRLGRALPDGPNAVLVNLPKADRDRPCCTRYSSTK
jgi:hypothetical protein